MPEQTFIATFDDLASYRKYKKEVTDNGGEIVNDLGETLLGFTVKMRPTLVNTLFSGNLAKSGISSFEADSEATIQ